MLREAVCYELLLQPAGLKIRVLEAGFFAIFAKGRRGLLSNSPLQFGQIFCSLSFAHATQNVHSNEQIMA